MVRAMLVWVVSLSSLVYGQALDEIRQTIVRQREAEEKQAGRVAYEVIEAEPVPLNPVSEWFTESMRLVARLNRQRHERATLVFDGQGNLRRDRQDRRDLDALMAAYPQIDPHDICNLDRTATDIWAPGDLRVNYNPRIRYLGFLAQDQVLGGYRAFVGTGLPNDYWLSPKEPDNTFVLSLVDAEGRRVLAVKETGFPSGKQWEGNLYLDPELNYKFRRYEVVWQGAVVLEYEARDYRQFDGVWLPTLFEYHRYSEDGQTLEQEKTIIIHAAEFRPTAAPPEAFVFEVPAGTQIDNMRLAEGGLVDFRVTDAPEMISVAALLEK